MVQKDTIIYELNNVITTKLDILSKNSPMFNTIIRPYIEEVIAVNIDKLDKLLTPITRSDGMINATHLLDNMTDRLVLSEISKINGIEIGKGTIKIDIPFINKSVILTKDDINDFKKRLEKYGSNKEVNTSLQNNA